MALAEIERLAHGPAKARANAQRALELYERKGVVWQWSAHASTSLHSRPPDVEEGRQA